MPSISTRRDTLTRQYCSEEERSASPTYLERSCGTGRNRGTGSRSVSGYTEPKTAPSTASAGFSLAHMAPDRQSHGDVLTTTVIRYYKFSDQRGEGWSGASTYFHA